MAERNAKTKPEQWVVIINYLELHPKLLNKKHESFDGDNEETKKLWKVIVDELNGMGFGIKTVDKWQLAISRWKSKVKAKAAAIRADFNGTGGGPKKSPPLTPIEERLLNLTGWKCVTGDGNKEIGIEEEEKNQLSNANIPLENINGNTEVAVVPPDTTPPPLVYLEEGTKRKRLNSVTPKKLSNDNKQSLADMHTDMMGVLTNIEGHLASLSSSQKKLTDTFETYLNFKIQQNPL